MECPLEGNDEMTHPIRGDEAAAESLPSDYKDFEAQSTPTNFLLLCPLNRFSLLQPPGESLFHQCQLCQRQAASWRQILNVNIMMPLSRRGSANPSSLHGHVSAESQLSPRRSCDADKGIQRQKASCCCCCFQLNCLLNTGLGEIHFLQE